MQIDYRINAFCTLLASLNWEISKAEMGGISVVRIENNSLYRETVNMVIIKNYNTPDFSRQLLSTIEKAIQLDNRIRNKPQTKDLISFLDNYQRQYSKKKINWIIPESNSKYTNDEIPSIYIP